MLQEFLLNTVFGVDPFDQDAVADAIRQINTDPELRERLEQLTHSLYLLLDDGRDSDPLPRNLAQRTELYVEAYRQAERELEKPVPKSKKKHKLTKKPKGQGKTKEPEPKGRMPAAGEILKELTSSLPADYEGRLAALSEIAATVRAEVAIQLQPVLNAKIQAMPHENYKQKKELAHWVNGQLEPLGLALKCPKTGQPAKLYGDIGARPQIGRFQFVVSIPGERPKRTLSADVLPELILMDGMPKDQSQTIWQQDVGTINVGNREDRGPGDSYEDLSSGYEARIASIRQTVVPALIEAASGKPHSNYSEKHAFVHWLNAELKRFDLTLHSASTGGLVTLTAERGGAEGKGRFRLKSRSPDESEKFLSTYTNSVEGLIAATEIIQAPQRREALSEWRSRLNKPSSNQGIG